MTASAAASAPRRSVDLALLALALALTAFTAVVLIVPAVVPALVNDRLDVGIMTAATLVSFAVAALAWSRGRVGHDVAALLRGSAFAVLGMLNALVLAVQVIGAEASFGSSLDDPGQWPLLSGIAGRGTCAFMLVLAGVVQRRSGVAIARPALLLLGPTLLVGVVIMLGALVQPSLPAIAGEAALDELSRSPTAGLTPGSAPLLVMLQSAIAVAFLLAAVMAHREYLRSGRIGDALLAGGLVIAAFSQVHGAIHPGSFASVVTTGDFLRLAFYAALLAAIVADSRDDLRALRQANVEVRRLADAQLATVALEERARLAREIHDGLAQDLWYAKLKQTRLAQLASFSGEARELSDEVGDAIDAALAEARHAVSAMREGTQAGSFVDMLTRHVEDFADRFAIRTELTCDGPDPEVGPRAQAELLRIVQEALTNVRKHADATVVRVALSTGSDLRLTVIDNGRGFRPEGVVRGFGLDSMRQRAAVIGGELAVRSEPQNGSRVEVTMPITSPGDNDGA